MSDHGFLKADLRVMRAVCLKKMKIVTEKYHGKDTAEVENDFKPTVLTLLCPGLESGADTLNKAAKNCDTTMTADAKALIIKYANDTSNSKYADTPGVAREVCEVMNRCRSKEAETQLDDEKAAAKDNQALGFDDL